ncbi:uncharacterized protein BXZ73DRAFT_89614 [Epithele typhae]|uniref:uncharacterized protein n=1 Tax=Epithele typhae TaxID=378194 RepID=UPI0020082B95|nr:uncharacterized protein BXZ73DRAFT_89614 [Epithele typhae]KAH9934530.1 hypothetical protein BXZ73DRAFT_89614 [Epithele typhae]
MNPPVTHHPRLYFDNGDIVLIAPRLSTTSSPCAFRVHKHVLSDQSAIFSHLFEDAAPERSDMHDGVPLIHLGDDAEDISLLLTSLYFPSELSFQPLTPSNLLSLTTILRLADKYFMDDLRAHLISQVTSDWPTTLEAWDARQASLRALPIAVARRRAPEPVTAIAFARAFDVPSLLPAAFYQLATTAHGRAWGRALRVRTPPAHWDDLPSDDWMRWARGRAALGRVRADVGDHIAHRVAFDLDFAGGLKDGEAEVVADDSTMCFDCVEGLFGACASTGDDGVPGDPLWMLEEALRKYEERKEEEGRLCGSCERGFEARIQATRLRIWKNLPRFFELK